MDPEIKKIYDILTPRSQQLYDVLEKYDELTVRDAVEKAKMQTQTVKKCLDELFERSLASFYYRPRRRKCWFLIKKGAMQYDKIMKTIEDELAELRSLVKQAEKAYRSSPNEKTLAELIRLGQLILEELSIPTIMYAGIKDGDQLKHWTYAWTYAEHELKKILFYLMNIDMMPIRTALKFSKAANTTNLRINIRNSLKNQNSENEKASKPLEKK